MAPAAVAAAVVGGSNAPCSPAPRLVVRGIYRSVRNPMIIGVICLLAVETLFFWSATLAEWAGIFTLFNVLFIPLWQEPDLVQRFGDDYRNDKRNVPRWVPRWTPWSPKSGQRP